MAARFEQHESSETRFAQWALLESKSSHVPIERERQTTHATWLLFRPVFTPSTPTIATSSVSKRGVSQQVGAFIFFEMEIFEADHGKSLFLRSPTPVPIFWRLVHITTPARLGTVATIYLTLKVGKGAKPRNRYDRVHKNKSVYDLSVKTWGRVSLIS
jgi:hypothetical protein